VLFGRNGDDTLVGQFATTRLLGGKGADTLIGLGVPLAQGFLLARPGAELAGLDADLAAHAREQAARRRDARSIGALVEPVAALPAQAPPEQVAARFAGDPALEYVAMADEAGRPVAIITREASAAGRTPTEPLRIETRDAVRPAARRAMSRPSPERFDPLTCCDDQGRLVGVVRVERLVEFLSR